MSQGWVKNWRKLKEWEWYTTPNMAHLFQHLIREANHEPKHWRGITVETGQVVTSLPHLKRDTGISVRSLRTCLDRLKSTGEIASKSTNKYRLLTICNYESYQSSNGENDRQTDRQAAVQRQTTDRQPTANKNDKNEKNDKKKERERAPAKQKFLEFVFLRDDEHQKLIERLGDKDTRAYIERLNNYIGSKGKKYKSHYHTILNWRQKDAENRTSTGASQSHSAAPRRDFDRQHSELGETIDV